MWHLSGVLIQAYGFPEGTAVNVMDQTVEGLHVGSPLVHWCESGSGPETLGLAVILALGEHRSQLPHVTDWKGLLAPLLKCCGVRSWAALQRRAHCVSIERRNDAWVVSPSRNGGASGPDRGYHSIEGADLRLDAAVGATELGVAVIEAFRRCS